MTIEINRLEKETMSQKKYLYNLLLLGRFRDDNSMAKEIGQRATSGT